MSLLVQRSLIELTETV